MPKILIEFDINTCKDCPFYKEDRDMGALISYCNNPEVNVKHISDNKKIQNWCPLDFNQKA